MLLKVKCGLSPRLAQLCLSCGVRPGADGEGQVGPGLTWGHGVAPGPGTSHGLAQGPGRLPCQSFDLPELLAEETEARAHILRSLVGLVTLLTPGGLGPVLADVGEAQASFLLCLYFLSRETSGEEHSCPCLHL